jgi:hypothetical protein
MAKEISILKALNESKKTKIEDYAIDKLIHFKDGEVWKVVKSGLRGSNNRKQSDEVTIKPFNKIAKDKNVSLAIDVNLDYLNANVVKIVDESVEEEVNERVQIKRKYGEYGAHNINTQAPIRNRVVEFVGKRYVTNEELKNFLTSLEEDRGNAIDQRKWFSRNEKYFESKENRGQQVWSLSKFGKRVLEQIVKAKTQNQKGMIKESIGLFKFSTINESNINEGSHGMATKLLQSLVKGETSEVEGIKLSKDLAQHFVDWIRTSPFGKKNANLPLYMLIKASYNWGIERGLDAKLKPELADLKKTINESVDEGIDVRYWTDYHDVKSRNPMINRPSDKQVQSEVETCVEYWNDYNENGKENEVTPAGEKKVLKLAKEFAKAAGWISIDVIEAMIAQES